MIFADTVIENADVVTMNPDQPRAEAVAIAGRSIMAVGSNAEIAALVGPQTRRIDAQGNTVLPGFVEAHLHLFSGAMGLQLLQLDGVQGLEQLTPLLRQYAAENPRETLLICKAADYNLMGPGQSVTRHDLDQALPDRPVILIAGDHHTAWANTIALDRAGVLHGREMPIGNEIVMGPDGLATGELLEFYAYTAVLALRSTGGREDLGFTGSEPARDVTPAERAFDLDLMRSGLAYCASFGFTSLHNMDGNFYQLDLLAELEAGGDLICRTEVPFHLTPEKPVSSLKEASLMQRQFNSDKLRSGRVKLFMDGVVDSGTAFFLEDYADESGLRGDALHSVERFNEIAIEADRRGLQISVHAIGDAAVRRVLDGYEAAREANGPRDSRHRIEHIEVLHPDDLPRIKDLGVVASMQPSHPPAAMDFPWDPWRKRVGAARWDGAFPVAALREAGVPIAFASDWPVADINPMRGVQAAMTRPKFTEDGPDNRVTLDQALEYYTRGGAYAGFDEHRLGSLIPGMLADIVVMDHRLHDMPVDQLGTARAAMTLCDGVVIWQA